jgi:hypothetical protein
LVRIKRARGTADNDDMSAALGLRVRFLAVVLILAAAALAAGFLVLRRLNAASDGDTATTPVRPAPRTHAKPSRPGPLKLTAHAKKPAPPKPARPAVPRALRGLPADVSAQLEANHVVVVSLYAPKAEIEKTAMMEAQAGARLAGAAFASVDVTTRAIDGLNHRYDVLQDPAVLVLRPPKGDLVVRIDGFADRDTVAQAAVDAAS